MPRLARKLIDAAEMQTGLHRPRKLKPTGPAKESLEDAVIEPADRMPSKEWSEQMAMNEEKVKIIVHETTDKNANQIPDIYVNGIPQRFLRGQEQVIRWKFVELLARCRETIYTQQKYRDDDGNEGYRNIPHTALKYPFSMVDASQKFHDRLKAVMAEV